MDVEANRSTHTELGEGLAPGGVQSGEQLRRELEHARAQLREARHAVEYLHVQVREAADTLHEFTPANPDHCAPPLRGPL